MHRIDCFQEWVIIGNGLQVAFSRYHLTYGLGFCMGSGMDTEQIRTLPKLVGKPLGRPKGSKGKAAIVADVPARVAGKDTPGKHKLIYSLHLAGELPQAIAKQAGVAVETVRSVIKLGDRTLSAENRNFLIDMVRTTFVKTMDSHNMISNNHIVAFRATQIRRDKAIQDLEALKQGSQAAAGLLKRIASYDSALRIIGRELTSCNKAFVELLVRMGVPHHSPTTTNGSHTDGSADNNFYDSMPLAEAEIETMKTVEKQLTYLKKQVKLRKVEKDD